ncbi:DNA polymerase/3'-5' exonuclease PolX [Alteribacillus sp. HJP-4]|uniref:DNA polymerase/3'-5' exonuclease PolX n=1 Tax=Alteribacillus sp. HJP-4 TaxID=2775394 RepID=UPI0035CD044D
MNKKELIYHLETIAVYMELKGENPFKTSAYRKAAAALEQDERSISEIDDPAALSGIGKGTAAVIQELQETGTSVLLESLKKDVPDGLVPLLKLPGLGGKKLARLYKELDVTDAATLKKVCEDKKIQKLSGFGEKSEEKILTALEEAGTRPERLPISFMLDIAEQLEAELSGIDSIIRFARAGSLRRMEETIKDLDYIVAVDEKKVDEVRKKLTSLSLVNGIIADGETKVSVELAFDYTVQADFRIVADDVFFTTLHHFTGSKEHNVLMRQLAKKQGEKISEYGVESAESGKVKTFASEEAFFQHFDLHFIPPEARLGREETEIFKKPLELVSLSDIRGDLHMHTTWSDGAQSVEEMAEEGRSRGYDWIAITDHSKFLQVAHGLDEERILRQIKEIQRVNKAYVDIEVLAGIEMDIRPDGKLDIEDRVLKELDFVIASIHSSFSQSQEQIMERFESALQSPYVHMIAHPTGRLIGRRGGYKVDIDKLIQRAAETNTALELNANPNRLDLSAESVKKAAAGGVMIAVNTDAHHPGMMDHMEVGVGTAKKAFLTKEQILNTKPFKELKQFLTRKKTQNNSE